MKIVKKFKSLPTQTKIELFLYPLFLIFQMPIIWVRSIYSCRVLLEGRWERYGGCHPIRSYQHFFTRIQYFNICKYGRSGTTPLLGTGNFKLSKLFHVSLWGHYLYANAGAAAVLYAGIFWSISHLIWLNTAQLVGAFCILLYFFSSYSFAMSFSRQNYTILGWMWAPLVLYCLINEKFILGIVFTTLISLFSFTAIFYTGIIIIMISILKNNFFMVLVLVPAAIQWLISLASTHDYSIAKLFETFLEMLKLIGGTNKNVKYSYSLRNWRQLDFLYLIISYGMMTTTFLIYKNIPFLIITGIFMLIFNNLVKRVADEQTIIIVLIMLTFCQIVSVHFNWIIAAIFWICVCPPPFIFQLPPTGEKQILHLKLNVLEPFDHTSLIDLPGFLSSVDENKRVLFQQ